MSQKNKTPTHKAEALRKGLDATLCSAFTASQLQVQHLVTVFGVSPELAVTLAALVFGSGNNV